MNIQDRDPIAASESERLALNKIEDVLEDIHRVPKLVGFHGEEIELPRSVFHVLRQLVYHLAKGSAVSVVPIDQELTTQVAALVLNMSRPYLVKLLEQGKIPCIKAGTHRRIRFHDLMDYKHRRDAERRRGLAKLTQLSQELGLYED